MTPPTVSQQVSTLTIYAAVGTTYVYGTNNVSGTIVQYSIGADGPLTLTHSLATATLLQPYNLALDQTGAYAYVANRGSTTISQFTVSASGFTPETVPTVPAGTHPTSIVTSLAY
jgi:6-phosphogluconolactonase (cycloisomerase 2 family)